MKPRTNFTFLWSHVINTGMRFKAAAVAFKVTLRYMITDENLGYEQRRTLSYVSELNHGRGRLEVQVLRSALFGFFWKLSPPPRCG